MLKELKEELKNHKYTEKAELTDTEIATMKEMFSIQDSYNTLFKYLLGIESDKGVQLAYDMEMVSEGTDAEIAEEVKLKKMLTKFVRLKMNKIRSSFQDEIEEEIKEKEAEVVKTQEENKKDQKDNAQDAIGIGTNV